MVYNNGGEMEASGKVDEGGLSAPRPRWSAQGMATRKDNGRRGTSNAHRRTTPEAKVMSTAVAEASHTAAKRCGGQGAHIWEAAKRRQAGTEHPDGAKHVEGQLCEASAANMQHTPLQVEPWVTCANDILRSSP